MTGTRSAPACSATRTNPFRLSSTRSRVPGCDGEEGLLSGAAQMVQPPGERYEHRPVGWGKQHSDLASASTASAAPPTTIATAPGPAARRSSSMCLLTPSQPCSRQISRTKGVSRMKSRMPVARGVQERRRSMSWPAGPPGSCCGRLGAAACVPKLAGPLSAHRSSGGPLGTGGPSPGPRCPAPAGSSSPARRAGAWRASTCGRGPGPPF